MSTCTQSRHKLRGSRVPLPEAGNIRSCFTVEAEEKVIFWVTELCCTCKSCALRMMGVCGIVGTYVVYHVKDITEVKVFKLCKLFFTIVASTKIL